MRYMTGGEIRQKFLEFFVSKGHSIEPSASLIPYEDPSLLWINSGVATLKPYFDGRKVPENPRITNSQKSIRTNDIEVVGKTARHHTFFEMLGNFSIGDYFKEEAITWAWEFLTSPEWIGFAPEKLSVTIHPEDEEAYRLWHEKIGIPNERIIKLESNFWDIGEGPSGPNTEIFYDRGEHLCNKENDSECYPGGENARYLEVWNLVFSQFNHNPDGTYTTLPKKNIDTGMGLERMASIIQNVDTNYDTDLFRPIIAMIEQITQIKYNLKKEWDIAFKVIADHIRTLVFAIGDGALPSNEGRGYVLRRLLRRAVRYGKNLGMEEPFLYKLTPVVAEIMGDFYPEVRDKNQFIAKVIKNEEVRFHETLNEGLQILARYVEEKKKEGIKEISGAEAFRLYDTYGFPLDLTEDYAYEHDLTVDRTGFNQEMEEQRERARRARQDVDSMQVQGGILTELKMESKFVGYERLETESKILAIINNNQLVEYAGDEEIVHVILDVTPFYAESGGQIADIGEIIVGKTRLEVLDVQKAPNGQHLQRVKVLNGSIQTGESGIARVNAENRKDIIKNHTATHLLHRALKDVLGEHVNQAGSLVAADRLRFDFSHISAITPEELTLIEEKVNEQIWNSLPVTTMLKSLQEAKTMGAMALFGEKYGSTVRVVKVGDYSLELCGGCHVNNSAEIGIFKILNESSIGAGIRRIEAVTGKGAYNYLNQQLNVLKNITKVVKAQSNNVLEKVESLLTNIKELEQEKESLTNKINNFEVEQIKEKFVNLDNIKLLAAKVKANDMDSLRNMIDNLKKNMESVIIVLGAVNKEKVNLVSYVSQDLISKGYHAGELIKEIAKRLGGSGGGKADFAQAGGKNLQAIDEALRYAEEYILHRTKVK